MTSRGRARVAVLLLAVTCLQHPSLAGELPPNAWTPLEATGDGPDYGGLPGKRGWIQVAYDRLSQQVVMFGGDADTYLSDLWEYKFKENHWHRVRPHPDLQGPCRRDNHNLVYDSAHRRYWLWNGSIGDNTGSNAQPECGQESNNQDQWTYDPAANVWMRRGRSPDRMLASGAAFDPTTRTILQFGGDRALSSTTTDWTFIMDTETGSWTRVSGGTPPAPSTNIQGALVYVSSLKKFLLFGGRNGAGSKVAHNQTWTFDPEQRKWQRLNPPTSPPARDLHSMVFDSANNVVILRGGRSAGRATIFADTWVFDPRTTTWTDLTPLLASPGPAMHYGSAIYDPGGGVMLMIPGEWGRDVYAFRYRPDLLRHAAAGSRE